MVRVVGVRFKKAGKIYYFDPADHPVTVGCKVIVETARGLEYGDVAIGPKYVPDDEVVQPLRPVIRVATEADALQAQANKAKEREAFAIALERIEAHGLEMNLVDVEYTFDGSKIIFSFTAEGRVDFRELVRDLASIFRTRIEMRQIGVRDEAKLIGGIGPCGRILCCTSFLGEFAPVSIRMAKDQNLALNPTKISGLCGRLMCCLRYEQDTYEAAKQDPSLAPGYVPPVLPAAEEELEESGSLAWSWLKSAAEVLGTEEEVGGRLGRAVAERNAARTLEVETEEEAPAAPVLQRPERKPEVTDRRPHAGGGGKGPGSPGKGQEAGTGPTSQAARSGGRPEKAAAPGNEGQPLQAKAAAPPRAKGAAKTEVRSRPERRQQSPAQAQEPAAPGPEAPVPVMAGGQPAPEGEESDPPKGAPRRRSRRNRRKPRRHARDGQGGAPCGSGGNPGA